MDTGHRLNRGATTIFGRACVALISILLAACGGGSGGSSDNSAPQASIRAASTGVVGESVTLDGGRSSDPDGDTLSYRWRIAEAPSGSNASLTEAATGRVTLTPDVAGGYRVELVTSDGSADSPPAAHTLDAYSQVSAILPLADLGEDALVRRGEPVELSLDLPIDLPPAGSLEAASLDSVGYQWSFTHRPTGSSTPLSADERSARFTPDLNGRYTVRVTLTQGEREHRFEKTVHAGDGAQDGVLFTAEAGTAVSAATYDFFIPAREIEARTSDDQETGERILRTEVNITFAPETLVETANQVLESVDARIVSMVSNTRSVIARIPDPGDLGGLREVLEALGTRSSVETATRSVLLEAPRTERNADAGDRLETQALPGGITAGNTQDMNRTDHHLAVRGHAAWNMQGVIPANVNNRPWLLIGDFFGDGAPDGDYAAITRGGDYNNFGPGGDPNDCQNRESCDHGYHVLGIILGDYGPGPGGGARDDVTGLYPAALRVRAMDISTNNTVTRNIDRMVQLMNAIRNADGNARIVANTSLGMTNPDADDIEDWAQRYAAGIRDNGLEDVVVHATSAGNTATDNNGNTLRWPARINSAYSFATLGDIRGFLGFDIDELDNILVVENRTNDGTTASFRHTPDCLSGGSLVSGNISGIGSSVYSFGRATFDGAGNVTGSDSRQAQSIGGTSMSSPQVAALAAWVWSLDRSLTGPQVVNRIIGTARSDYVTGCARTPQPVIDAYHTLRRVGGDAVRTALHDTADNSANPGADGRFDGGDLEYSLSQFPASLAVDYSRFDFNGDGVTDADSGSSNTDQVDLDGDGSLGTLNQTLLGHGYTWNEASATDIDVLCYDAFSSAYTGTASRRAAALGQPCGIVDLEITDPPGGHAVTEGKRVRITADITINGTHDGDVTLHTGGGEVDRYNGYSYLDNWPLTLSTRRVCPEDPTVTMRWRDAQTGLEAADTVELTVNPATLHATISGPDPRYARVRPGPTINDLSFSGRGRLPTCSDPHSDRLDQASLEWLDDGFNPVRDTNGQVATGTDLDLPGSYLDDGAGGFAERRLRLAFTRDGRTVRDDVLIKPCTSDLGRTDAVAGYPSCPTSAVAGEVMGDLFATFDVSSLDELNQRIGIIINGIPDYRAVLEELDRPLCDPTHCDPAPTFEEAPNFPYSLSELQQAMTVEEYREQVITYVTRMHEAFGAASPGAARESLNQIAADIAEDHANEALSDDDLALLQGAYSAGLAAMDYFASAEAGGNNGWATFMTESENAALLEGGDTQRPARRALTGYLTALVDTGTRSAAAIQETAVLNDAASYGAAIGAAEEYLAFKGAGGG